MSRLAFNVLGKAFAFAVSATVLAAHGAFAEGRSEMSLDVSYLAAPTDWCPADAGVPMKVAMDGPDIIRGPGDFPRKVKVRRGSEVTIFDGENINSYIRADDFDGPNAEVIGRFSAEFQSCFSAFNGSRANGTWTLLDLNGGIAESGAIEDEYLSWPLSVPFFRAVAPGGSSNAHYARFGDHRLFAAARPEAETKQSFLADPDKE
jgi:hypothetical protein